MFGWFHRFHGSTISKSGCSATVFAWNFRGTKFLSAEPTEDPRPDHPRYLSAFLEPHTLLGFH